MKKWLAFSLLVLSSCALSAQTVNSVTNFTTTELECVSDYVDFNSLTRYFTGLVVKQGTRLYYLDNSYTIEVLNERIVFDDSDRYTDRVSVDLGRTGYADIAEFKAAAAACLSVGGATDTTCCAASLIDSISYYNDTLRVYVGGDPVPFSTEIITCGCDVVPPTMGGCILVIGDPGTGEVWGDPATGVVWSLGSCYSPPPFAMGEPDTGEVWGDPGAGSVWGWLN